MVYEGEFFWGVLFPAGRRGVVSGNDDGTRARKSVEEIVTDFEGRFGVRLCC